jgi:hypothetical protein
MNDFTDSLSEYSLLLAFIDFLALWANSSAYLPFAQIFYVVYALKISDFCSVNRLIGA